MQQYSRTTGGSATSAPFSMSGKIIACQSGILHTRMGDQEDIHKSVSQEETNANHSATIRANSHRRSFPLATTRDGHRLHGHDREPSIRLDAVRRSDRREISLG